MLKHVISEKNFWEGSEETVFLSIRNGNCTFRTSFIVEKWYRLSYVFEIVNR